MLWTLNDSIDHAINDTENSKIENHRNDGQKKISIFHRTNKEKMDYLKKTYLETDEKNEKIDKNGKSGDGKQDAFELY